MYFFQDSENRFSANREDINHFYPSENVCARASRAVPNSLLAVQLVRPAE